MLRMDEVNKCRKAYNNGDSINQIAKRYGRSWTTIKNIVETPLEELENRGCRPNRMCTVTTPEVEDGINGYLTIEEQLGVKKKQRYTAALIYKELTAKGIYKGSVRQLQDAVKQLRQQRGQVKVKSHLPLEFPLGSTAQIDHGECDLIVGEQRVLGYLFVCSIPGAVLRYCQIFPVKSREAWGEFHERSYQFFGGVLPIGTYDNDCVLVKEVLGKDRKQTQFSHALEEHYQINSRFCNPAAGNEKGSVENGVGYCRRNYLAGCQSFESWDIVNENLEKSCWENIDTGHHYRTNRPLKDIFNEMAKQLNPLAINHKWRRWKEAHVDSYQLVHIDSQGYSVPERFVGSTVRIGVGVFDIEILSENTAVARHSRRFGESGSSLCLDHYLDQLMRKPGALWDCKAVQQHSFSPEFLEIWQRLQERYPGGKANRKFIKILHLGRKYGSVNLTSAIEKALFLRTVEPEALENIIHSSFTHEDSRLRHVKFDTWVCNLDQYAQLTGGSLL